MVTALDDGDVGLRLALADTTNLVERLNEEIRRRTRVARLFPNEAACLRLVSAVLMETSEDWQSAGKRYVVFNKELAIEG